MRQDSLNEFGMILAKGIHGPLTDGVNELIRSSMACDY